LVVVEREIDFALAGKIVSSLPFPRRLIIHQMARLYIRGTSENFRKQEDPIPNTQSLINGERRKWFGSNSQLFFSPQPRTLGSLD